jgi:hypothetical protein
MSKNALRTLACCLLVTLAGCGRSWPLNDNVEGTLKLDGAPVANVLVKFEPDDSNAKGPTSMGETDAKGHFQLTCDTGKPGAMIGKHNVIIFKGLPGPGEAVSTAVIPAAYTRSSKTPLQIEVTANEHNYDLNMSANPPPRKGS